MKKVDIIAAIIIALLTTIYVTHNIKKVPKEEVTTTETSTVIEITTETTTEETTEETTTITEAVTVTEFFPSIEKVYDDNEYIAPEYFRKMGEIYADGYRYTWYNEKVLPGELLDIPGRHSDGNYVRDENDYIVLASIDLPKGTVIETPFGTGKVYDECPKSGTIDVYVSW